MKTNEIMKKASGMIRKTGFKLRQSSPEILIVGGIIGVIGSAVTGFLFSNHPPRAQTAAVFSLRAAPAG